MRNRVPLLILVAVVAPSLAEDAPVKAKPGFEGEACAALALKKLGKAHTQDDVFDASGTDPALGRGCEPDELAAALTKLGFVSPRATASWDELRADLAKGFPSIVHGEAGARRWQLVTGYDATKDEAEVFFPATGETKKVARASLVKSLAGRLRLEPGTIAAPEKHEGFDEAAYAQKVMALVKGGKTKGFTILVEPPFVVLSDDSPEAAARYAAHTVRWAVRLLKKDFFEKDPADILEVWLFKDKKSYDENTRAIFGDSPDTPFGYYSPAHKALIMNIATGGGTLVHEIVHPFVHANCPECPAWLNEGLGSLFEQCEEKDGHIHGKTNWRLAGIQKAIKAGKVPTFEKLAAMSSHAFYDEDRGTNYGQARYLCYWLQEKGRLVEFWKKFLATRKDDPTGYKALERVAGEDDMAAWQKRWEDYVLGLTFP